MLTDAELHTIREDVEDTLPDEAIIRRKASVQTSGGGWEDTWNPVDPVMTWRGLIDSPVPCRISPRPTVGEEGRENLRGERVVALGVWVATFPAETDIEPADRVEINGRLYEVAYIRGARSYEVTRRVDVTTTE